MTEWCKGLWEGVPGEAERNSEVFCMEHLEKKLFQEEKDGLNTDEKVK